MKLYTFLTTSLVTALGVLAPIAGHATDVGATIREQRRINLALETGWNSLTGIGLGGGYQLTSHVALDGGIGQSVSGTRFGLRGRYNLLTSGWTPFVAAGAFYSAGRSRSETIENVDDDGRRTSFDVRLEGSAFAQGVAGMSYVGDGGFTFMAALGYAKLLGDDPVRVTKGTTGPADRRLLRTLYGSGPVISLAMGYAF